MIYADKSFQLCCVDVFIEQAVWYIHVHANDKVFRLRSVRINHQMTDVYTSPVNVDSVNQTHLGLK